MPSDYNSLRTENERRYGTDIGRIGPMLLAHRYGDRTHFIFELLQNAEDALERRGRGWRGPRAVNFELNSDMLRVGHYGEPFNLDDVRGICGIGQSTKEDFTAIGRFGIGFKSVYAFTARPEIHSGEEDFAIENFVWPVATPHRLRKPDETAILIPLKNADDEAHGEIAAGLARLGPSTLLFLRQIEEVHWSVEKGGSGVYLRESKRKDVGVRQVDIIGEEQGKTELGGRWLVFSRSVTTAGGRPAGNVEIAFSVAQEDGSRRKRLQRVEYSPLVAFFPTVLETHLGFLIQGPYRTTPSRDNVPRAEPWNRHLVNETASLLVESLSWLRDHNLLDATALRCLPLESTKFGEDSMFAPVFGATKKALLSDPLLPRYDQGHIAATSARLARTQDLRDLFSPSQLAPIFDKKRELVWLSGDITQDRTPELRRYLIDELKVEELTPEAMVSKLNGTFLKSQPDAWIVKFYEFLNGQPALRYRLASIPLIRLEDGSQVPAHINGQPQAFLPGTVKTGFPTVRGSVCATKTARQFLTTLGLTEPDPVDDVIHNILPRYRQDKLEVKPARYATDLARILTAFSTDSKTRREALITALRDTAFVMVIDSGDESKWRSKPETVYLSTERLKELFSGVGKVFLVDDSYTCLRGESVRDLLEACGATRYLQPVSIEADLSWEDRREIRRNAGLERSTWQKINDATLRGLDELMELLPRLEPDVRRRRASLLWEALIDLDNRRGSRSFLGEYTWGYAQLSQTAFFDAQFVRKLNGTPWVPKDDGDLERPDFVVFDTLGWKANPVLQSKIHFKPPIIETLAREAGIEPGVLDLLKKFGLTSEAELRDRLGLNESKDAIDDSSDQIEQDVDEPDDETSASNPSGDGSRDSHSTGSQRAGGGGGNGTGQHRDPKEGAQGSGSGTGSSGTGKPGREFVSYVAVHTDEDEPDPDGLTQPARMALESKAIDLILLDEPRWERTPVNNPGYDLYELDADGTPTNWCEVKAMTGSLEERPVGLSRTQFNCAQEHGDDYWLYVVEHAGTDDARIVRIQDPAGKAATFTFDRGWIAVAAPTDGEPAD